MHGAGMVEADLAFAAVHMPRSPAGEAPGTPAVATSAPSPVAAGTAR